jgi:predicted nucleotidyltransferase
MNYDQAIKHCIFQCLTGSQAYGISQPDSDYDYVGVFIAPPISLADIRQNVKEVQRDHSDDKLYEIRRAFELMFNCSPGFIEILFTPACLTIQTSDIWNTIVDHRQWFLCTEKVKNAFSGYATAQMKRIRTHRKYCLDPPKRCPTRQEYNLPKHTTISHEQRNAILSISPEYLKDEIRDLVLNENAFEQAKKQWDSYISWQQNRNQKRLQLEMQFGYDTKHAAHLVRLARMGIELICTGELKIQRPDAQELCNIRNGAWSYQQLEQYADDIDHQMQEAIVNSVLPPRVQDDKARDMLVSILQQHYGIRFQN